MTEMTEEAPDFQSLWDETDDEGKVVPADAAGETPETDVDDDSDGEEPEAEDAEGEQEEEEEGQEEDSSQEDEQEIDYEALWKKAQNEVKTMTGRLKATESRLTQEKDELARKVPPAPVAPSEEDAFLAKFKETYSEDVIKAIDLITARKATQIVESTLTTRLSPVEEATNEIITQAHFGAIGSAHPDFEEIDASPVFESWLQTRPIHTQAAYEHIRNHGTPAQVISMLTEYKETIGAVKPKTKPTKVSETKIAAATAVGRRRGTAQTAAQPDANDLAAIWSETDD
jgi:hypothetical protein